MPIDARIEELLVRYPDQLSDSELAELREAGEREAEVEHLMDRIHEVQGLLGHHVADSPSVAPALSPGGQRALDRILEDVDDSVVTDRSRLVSLASRRRRLSPTWTALAAMVLLGLSALAVVQLDESGTLDGVEGLTGPGGQLGLDPDLQMRGDLPDLMGNLEFEASPSLVQGMGRRIDQSVVFVVMVSLPAHLVLLETQGGQTHVLHPEPGQSWRLDAGTHRLEPRPGASAYRPATAGMASYALVGSTTPLELDARVALPSVAAFIAAHEDASLLDERSIRWTAVE